MLKMVEVDGVENQRAGAVERECAVGLVGFHHEGACPQNGRDCPRLSGDCPHAGDGDSPRFAADAPGGVGPEVLEQAGGEGGGGGFTMGSADGDAVCGVDEGGEDFAATADGDSSGAGGGEFGVVGRNGRGDDKLIDGHLREGLACCDLKVGRGMSDRYGDPVLLQPTRAGRGVKITPRDRAAAGF